MANDSTKAKRTLTDTERLALNRAKERERRLKDKAQRVACPLCGKQPGEPCDRELQGARVNHLSRLEDALVAHGVKVGRG